MKNYVYIDYENAGNNIKEYPKINGKYFFFVGFNQKSFPDPKLQPGDKKKVIKLTRCEKNAADFLIAYNLQKYDHMKDVRHFILSKDKGFDVLIEHVNQWRNRDVVTRIENLELFQGKVHDNNYEKAIRNLTSIAKVKHPKKEKTLRSYLKALLPSLCDTEINNINQQMYANKFVVKETDGKIAYK